MESRLREVNKKFVEMEIFGRCRDNLLLNFGLKNYVDSF